MSRTKTALDALNASKNRMNDFASFHKFMQKELSGWTYSLTWANGNPQFSLPVSGFLNPPPRYKMRGPLVMGDTDQEWVENAILALSRLILETEKVDESLAQATLRATMADVHRQSLENVRQANVQAAASAVEKEGDAPVSAPRRNVVKRTTRAVPKRGQKHRKRG